MELTFLPDELIISLIALLSAFGLYVILLCIAVFAFWFWMLFDCLKRPIEKFPNKNQNDRIHWTILIFTTFLIGATLYFLLIKSKYLR